MLGNSATNTKSAVKEPIMPTIARSNRPALDMAPVIPFERKDTPTQKKTRQVLQSEAVQRLLNNKRLIVEWGTGVGKSRVAINTLKLLADQGCNRFLLFVCETAHKDNWKKEFIEVLGKKEGMELFGKVTVECYNSIIKYNWTNWQCIVCDEAHHLRSDKRIAQLSTMQSKYMLCLSATLNENGDGDKLESALVETFGTFDRVSLTLQEAIDNDILSVPRIIVHVLQLEDISGTFTVDITWGFQKCAYERECAYEDFLYYYQQKNAKYPNMNLHVTCTAVQGYDMIEMMLDEIKGKIKAANTAIEKSDSDEEKKKLNKKLLYLRNEALQYGSKRKLFLGRVKTRFASSLIRKHFADKKYVCFCSDVEQGKVLGGDNVIHSKKSKENNAVINAFNAGEINSIYAIGMIQEGANLNGIETGLIVQLGGKERVFIQKFGRTMRSKNPVQHVIVIDKTQDVVFFEGSLKNIENMYLEYRKNIPNKTLRR